MDLGVGTSVLVSATHVRTNLSVMFVSVQLLVHEMYKQHILRVLAL